MADIASLDAMSCLHKTHPQRTAYAAGLQHSKGWRQVMERTDSGRPNGLGLAPHSPKYQAQIGTRWSSTHGHRARRQWHQGTRCRTPFICWSSAWVIPPCCASKHKQIPGNLCTTRISFTTQGWVARNQLR